MNYSSNGHDQVNIDYTLENMIFFLLNLIMITVLIILVLLYKIFIIICL